MHTVLLMVYNVSPFSLHAPHIVSKHLQSYRNTQVKLTRTYYSSILRMGAGTSRVIPIVAALSQVHFSPYTPHIAVPGWTTASSKGSRPRSFHCYQVPQLMAHNCSISKIPVVITHSAPLVKEENLNTPLLWTGPSHQSDSAFLHCGI